MRLAHRPGSSRLRVGAAPTGWAAARAPPVHCSLLGGLSDPTRGPPPESFSVGQQVTVIESVNFMHVPGHKGGFDAKGLTGKVLRVYALDARHQSWLAPRVLELLDHAGTLGRRFRQERTRVLAR